LASLFLSCGVDSVGLEGPLQASSFNANFSPSGLQVHVPLQAVRSPSRGVSHGDRQTHALRRRGLLAATKTGLRSASSCAWGSNASNFVVATSSVAPASLRLAVPLTRAGTVFMASHAPLGPSKSSAKVSSGVTSGVQGAVVRK
jgi:hypothetical protein